MKIDMTYMVQLFLIVTYLTIVSMYFCYLARLIECKKIKFNIVKLREKVTIKFSRRFITHDYICYEKYGVWRYCSLF